MEINGETQLIFFFGTTYKTSKMYAMYNAAFKALGLNYAYVPVVVDDLQKAVEGVKHLGIKAIGVTVPYKVSIMQYLDGLDKQAKKVGAVNAVVNENGKLIGYNTDGDGCVKALRQVTTVEGKNVLLLGAGGAARAIAFAIIDRRATLTILNRNKKTAHELAKRAKCKSDSLSELENHISKADIIINATTAGMTLDINTSLVKKSLLKPKQIVMDLVSDPKETKLLKEAKKAGCRIVYGSRMLLWQGVLKFKLYTNVEPPIEVMKKVFV